MVALVKIKFLADGLRDSDDALPPDGQRGEVGTTPMSGQCHAPYGTTQAYFPPARLSSRLPAGWCAVIACMLLGPSWEPSTAGPAAIASMPVTTRKPVRPSHPPVGSAACSPEPPVIGA